MAYWTKVDTTTITKRTCDDCGAVIISKVDDQNLKWSITTKLSNNGAGFVTSSEDQTVGDMGLDEALEVAIRQHDMRIHSHIFWDEV